MTLAKLDERIYKTVLGCLQSGQPEQAEAVLSPVLEERPEVWLFQYAQGLIHAAQRNYRSALAQFRTVLRLNPDHWDSRYQSALMLLQMEQNLAARDAFTVLLRDQPDLAELHLQMASACRQCGSLHDALRYAKRAVELTPAGIDALFLLADLYLQQGKVRRAVECWQKILNLAPHHSGARQQMGEFFLQQHDYAKALQEFLFCLQADPEQGRTYLSMGICWQALGQFRQSFTMLRQACQRMPESLLAWFNLGVAAAQLEDYRTSQAAFEQALRLSPQDVDSRYNLGNALVAQGKLVDAEQAFNRVVTDHPDAEMARFNRGIVRLLSGNYAEGWQDYESRWHQHTPVIEEPAPRWQGESLQGCSILLYCEQGLGDTLQFCRYVQWVISLGASVTLLVQDALAALLAAQSWPIELICLSEWGGAAGLVSAASESPELGGGFESDKGSVGSERRWDFSCPLMSLPRLHQTTPDHIPAPHRYLWFEVSHDDRCSRRPRIGLAWSGNASHANDKHRSIPLETLISYLPGAADYICLQTDIRESDQATFQHSGIQRPLLNHFADTAAVLQSLDLVICVDTSVAHLAGAMGIPTWVLLPWLGDWRWGMHGETTPWYASMRLWRQMQPGQWSALLHCLNQALEARLTYSLMMESEVSSSGVS